MKFSGIIFLAVYCLTISVSFLWAIPLVIFLLSCLICGHPSSGNMVKSLMLYWTWQKESGTKLISDRVWHKALISKVPSCVYVNLEFPVWWFCSISCRQIPSFWYTLQWWCSSWVFSVASSSSFHEWPVLYLLLTPFLTIPHSSANNAQNKNSPVCGHKHACPLTWGSFMIRVRKILLSVPPKSDFFMYQWHSHWNSYLFIFSRTSLHTVSLKLLCNSE